jgi:hypothetical protein
MFSVLNNFSPDLLSFPYFSPEPKLMSTTNLGEKAAPAKFACCDQTFCKSDSSAPQRIDALSMFDLCRFSSYRLFVDYSWL